MYPAYRRNLGKRNSVQRKPEEERLHGGNTSSRREKERGKKVPHEVEVTVLGNTGEGNVIFLTVVREEKLCGVTRSREKSPVRGDG